MTKHKIKEINFRKAVEIIKKVIYITKIGPLYVSIQLFSSLIIAFLDGLSVGLLLPLAKGIIDSDFSFLETVPVFKNIIFHFPILLEEASVKFIFILLILIIFAVNMARNTISYAIALYSSYQNRKFTFNIGKAMFARYLRFGKMYFDKTSHGEITVTMGYSQSINQIMLSNLLIFRTGLTFLFYFGIMIFISWKLTLFIVVIFPVLHYSVDWIIRKIKVTATVHTELAIRLARQIFNTISCIPLVKAYAKEKEAMRKYISIDYELVKVNFSMEKKRKLIDPLQEIIALSSILLLISAAAFIFLKEKFGEIGNFLVFFYIIRKTLPLFKTITLERANLMMATPRFFKAMEIFNDKDKFFVMEGDKRFTGLKKNIEFKHLNFFYRKKIQVLKDISFSAEKGKVTAIVGPTGAGKTTIANLLLRFYNCPPGTIFIDGVEIEKFTSASLKEHIALVSQNAFLFNDTLKYNITFACERKIENKEIFEVLKKARLYDFVMKLPNGLDEEAGDRGIKLSGGEKQRLSIARALLKNTEILILDEATSSLDTKTERIIHESIEEATKNKTTIVINLKKR